MSKVKKAKYQAKPRFWKIFLGRVGIMLLVGIVICAAMTIYYEKERVRLLGLSEYIQAETIKETLVDLSDEAEGQRVLNYYTAMAPYTTGKFVNVYDNGELIASTRSAIFMRNDALYTENIYYKEWDYYLDFDEQDIQDFMDYYDGHVTNMYFNTAINSPLVRGFLNNSYQGLMYSSYSYSMSPLVDEATGEFTFVNTPSNSNSSNVVNKEMYSLSYLDRVATEVDFQNGSTYEFSNNDSNGMPHKYEVKYSDYIYMRNPFDNTGLAMYMLCVYVLGVCIIVAVIWSIVVYYSRKNIYDVYVYRNSITNKLAHDLKTPLMAITSMAETYKGSSNPEKKDHYVDKIADNALYMDSIISRTLELASSETGNINVTKEKFNSQEVITEIIELLEIKAKENNLKFDTTDVVAKTINTDRSIFKNALICLMENAINYAVPDTVISVSNSSKVMSITNEFKGQIDNVESLKEPYVRGSKSRSTKGSGLGLAIANEGLINLGYELILDIKDSKFTATIR